ncbi:MAG: sigma-70 family RNA polymerase sigma factor [Actinobacteria bacterium]|nr:sigma-70 family RNA polymerase sigma factor [Actinomycetota bacterium]
MDEPDPQLIAAATAGDLVAFEKIVRRYQTDVVRLALHVVRDMGAAEDAAQEAFVRAFRFLPRYRGDSKFSTWLFSIVRNCALDELRRLGRGGVPSEHFDTNVAAHHSDTQLGLEIREAMGELPLDLREAVILIDMFGMSYREAAAVVRTAEGTLKSRVHRARQLLMHALRAETEDRADER